MWTRPPNKCYLVLFWTHTEKVSKRQQENENDHRNLVQKLTTQTTHPLGILHRQRGKLHWTETTTELSNRTIPQIRRLPDTPPGTPTVRKMKLRKHATKNVFDDHKTVGVFGGNLSSPTARELTRVLNEMHRGLVRSGGTFSSINADGTGMTSSTKIKNTIRNVVLNGGAQTSEQESIVRELTKRGVRLTNWQKP